MNVLVTGATGFVGSALIKRLLQENVHLFAAVMDGENTSHLSSEIERVIVQPLSDACDYSSVLQNIDIVIHLAARVHIMHDSASDPLQKYLSVNLHGTERLARQAAQAGVKRFVFISTVKVLGEETAKPYREDSPQHPLDPYGTSKAEAENALWRIAAESGLEVVIVRPPLVYGPGVKANFQQLINAVNRGVPLPFASIRNKRSFIYVENLADALACCAFHPNAAGQTYLVSDGEDVSTPELIRRVAFSMGIPARLFSFQPDIMRFVGRLLGKSSAVERLVGSLQVDSSKICKELDWRPLYDMEQGLAKTVNWYLKKGD